MDNFAQQLIAERDYTHTVQMTKVALDQHLRNIGAEILRAGGDTVGLFRSNPVTMGAATGALVGGGVNALRAQEGESRMQRFGRGAVGGAIGGATTGLIAGGAVRNLGRWGEEMSHQVANVRGAQRAPGMDVGPNAMNDVLGNSMSRTARRGVFGSARADGTSSALKQQWKDYDHMRAQLRGSTLSPEQREEMAKHLFQKEREMSRTAGGHFGYYTGPEAAAILGGTAIAGGAISNKLMNKESSARLYAVLEKGAFLAQGLTNLGARVGTMTPTAVGALGGAVVGAGAAGEGNRLGGALAGAALGAGAGAGAASGALGQGARNLSNTLTTGVQGLGSRVQNMATQVPKPTFI